MLRTHIRSLLSATAVGLLLASGAHAQIVRHRLTCLRDASTPFDPQDVLGSLESCSTFNPGCATFEVLVDVDQSVAGSVGSAGPVGMTGFWQDAIVRISVVVNGFVEELEAATSSLRLVNNYRYVDILMSFTTICEDEVDLRMTPTVGVPALRIRAFASEYDYNGASLICPSLLNSVAIDQNFCTGGYFSINFTPQMIFAAKYFQVVGEEVFPLNDDCERAEEIADYGSYAFDTMRATTDGVDLTGFCDLGAGNDNQIYNDVWFTLRPEFNGCTYISTLGGTSFDTKLAVYQASTCPGDPATVIACSANEIQPPSAPFAAGLDVVLSHGQLYYIRVGGSMPTSRGTGELVVSYGSQAGANDGGLQPGAPGCPSDVFPESCAGDGGNQVGCTPCPCGNDAPVGTVGGCASSVGTAARLLPSGSASVSLPPGSSIDLRFALSGGVPDAFCVLTSADAIAPQGSTNPCFGLGSGVASSSFDGLRCVVQNVQRHGVRSSDANGDVGLTTSSWGGANGPGQGIAAQAGHLAGQVRHFQVVYRDNVLLNCMSGLNTSQAVTVTFVP